jgi:pimeloyl-ACP methyl ester carboxylesterase
MVSTRIVTSADGEPVALHQLGGEGPALLLGHGNGLNAGMWAAVAPHLRHRFRCYGIDLRGHGAARPRNPDYSVARDRFAEDVLACIEAVGGGPVCYGGHSLGGAAALFAVLNQPELFRGLWLFEPVVVPLSFGERLMPSALIEIARRRRADFDSLDDAMARLSSKPPFASCDPVAVRAYLEIGTYPTSTGVTLSCRPENEARVFGSGELVDFARLGQVAVPTVVVAGGEGADVHAIPAQVAPLIAEALGNARFELHADLTHFGPMEAPAVIAASIAAHFDAIG